MRQLVIESSLETPNSYVVVDGNVITMLKSGKTVTIPIDENYHVLQCVVNTATEPRAYDWSDKVEILSGYADYKFYLESKKISDWDTIELVDDVQRKDRYVASLFERIKPHIRNLEIVNRSGIKEPISIVVDGVTVETVKPKKKATIQIDEKSHTISCFCKCMDSNSVLSTNEMKVFIGKEDYKYYIKNKNQSKFNLFFKGETEIDIELVEDIEQNWRNIVLQRKEAELMEEIRKIEEEEARKREEQLEQKVYDIINKETDKNKWEWNFPRALSVLSESERQNKGFKIALEFLVNLMLECAAREYCHYELVFSLLNNIKEIPECKHEVENILKYEDILCDRYTRIASVFTGMDNYAEAYERLEKKYLDKFQGYSLPKMIMDKYFHRAEQINETYKNKEYRKNLELQMFCNTEIQEFYELKELIIFVAMNPVADAKRESAIKYLDSLYDYFVAPIKETEKSSEHMPTVDKIIAKTIIFSRANLIDNVMEDLQKALEVIANKDERFNHYKGMLIITSNQFEVLRKVFEYYKAPKQEIAVLEAMYKYNIPRTIEQEQRLAFLKKGSINAPKMYENSTQSEVFQYDYRVLQWSESDITNYIENFTMNSKKCIVPMAVSNFEKSVMVQSFQWENKAIIPVLENSLQENFGDKYCIQNIECATVTDGTEDSIPAVFISEANSSAKGYPWLGFLVIGDQVTLKQMNLSIYALYLPNKIAETQNIVQANEKIISDVTVIKMKQNPRINNYISTVTNILVEVLEEWINNQMSYNIYS